MKPQTYQVKVKDKATDQEMTLSVTGNSNIKCLNDAIDHVAKMPTSHGGGHPGFEILTPKESAPAQPAA